MIVGIGTIRSDREPGLFKPRAKGIVLENLGFFHHDLGTGADALIHISGKPERLTGLEMSPHLIGLDLPVDRPGEQIPCQDRVVLERRFLGGGQLVRFRRDYNRGSGQQTLGRFGGIRESAQLQIRQIRMAPAEWVAGRELRRRGAVRELRSRLLSHRKGGETTHHVESEPVLVQLRLDGIIRPFRARTRLGGTPHLGLQHPAAFRDRKLGDAGRHAIEEGFAILSGHFDRIAGARAPAAVGRGGPRKHRSDASGEEDLWIEDLARHRGCLWDRSGLAAFAVQGNHLECRADAHVPLRRRPPDGFVEEDLVLRWDDKTILYSVPFNVDPFILCCRPPLQRAPQHLCDDESLGTLAKEMRRRQLDSVTIRAVKHHRPRAVDRDGETIGGTLEPGGVLGRRRDIVQAIGKLRRLELPRARLGVGFHLPCGHAVDHHIHQQTRLRNAAERGYGIYRLAITLGPAVRTRRQANGRCAWHIRHRRHP